MGAAHPPAKSGHFSHSADTGCGVGRGGRHPQAVAPWLTRVVRAWPYAPRVAPPRRAGDDRRGGVTPSDAVTARRNRSPKCPRRTAVLPSSAVRRQTGWHEHIPSIAVVAFLARRTDAVWQPVSSHTGIGRACHGTRRRSGRRVPPRCDAARPALRPGAECGDDTTVPNERTSTGNRMIRLSSTRGFPSFGTHG